MTKQFFRVGILSAVTTLLPAASPSGPQAPSARAWLILEHGVTSKKAGTRASAAHALRLVVHTSRAQEMAERALSDRDPKVRAAAARALGPMGGVSSIPKLKVALRDKEPNVVLAAAHSLFLLGDREQVYDIDYQLLNGERKTDDGFVQSQLNELHDPKAVATMGFETGIGFLPFGGEAYEVFKRVRKDDGTPVRVAAAKELATDRDPKIDDVLAKACSDKKRAVRMASIFAIAKRDNPALLPVIVPALEDKNEMVRFEAAAAVLRLTGGDNK
jgi:HEAT repeat protein